jgi:lipid II:glycine glycyltransferase (peptidoglycan interpeptide bridge formation enzyme)
MFYAYKNTKNYSPEIMVALKNKEIVGVLLCVIVKEYSGLLGYLSSRSIIFGGPLVKNNNPEIVDKLLSSYNKLIKGKVIYSQFRNLFNTNNFKLNFYKQHYKYNQHLNILIDLNKDKETLWKEVYSKRRNEIRKAWKNNVKFNIKDNKEDLLKCYDILSEVYNRAKLPLPPYDFFENLRKSSDHNQGLKIFVAEKDSKIIGCLIALVFKKTIYDYYAGSYRKFYKINPNDLLPWEIFLWGKQNNYINFDFGGAGKPNIPYGVRDYKKKFGGQFVNYGRYIKIHNNFLYTISKTGFKIWQKVKN